MPKRGEPANEAQRRAAKANLAKGRKARAKALKDNADHPTATERWAMLLSGQLTVKDLDDDEITKMALKGKGGVFGGRQRALPSHIIAAFEAERQVRWKRDIMAAVPTAVDALLDIINDAEHKDRAKMAQWFVERAMGKTPDVVQVTTGNEFDRVASEAIVVDRSVVDGAEAILAEDAARKDA